MPLNTHIKQTCSCAKLQTYLLTNMPTIQLINVTNKSLIVLFADPRRLLVSIRAGGFNIDVAVIHAPTTCVSAAEHETWMQKTSQLTQANFKGTAPIFVCADANTDPINPRPGLLGDNLGKVSKSDPSGRRGDAFIDLHIST